MPNRTQSPKRYLYATPSYCDGGADTHHHWNIWTFTEELLLRKLFRQMIRSTGAISLDYIAARLDVYPVGMTLLQQFSLAHIQDKILTFRRLYQQQQAQ